MKKFMIFILIFIIMLFGVNGTSFQWTTNDFNNHNNAQPTGSSLINNSWTNFTFSNCNLQTQPIVYNYLSDSVNYITVYCSNSGKTKVFDSGGNLIDELIIGVLQDNLQIVTDATRRLVGVYNISGDINITYIEFNGTDLKIDETFNNSLYGGGNTVLCPSASYPCFSGEQTQIEVDIFQDGTPEFCSFLQDGTKGEVVCYPTGYHNQTPVLNHTTLDVHGFRKLFSLNSDGGDSEIYATYTNIQRVYTDAIDSTGTLLWRGDLLNGIAGASKGASFLYGSQICVLNYETIGVTHSKLECYEFSGTITQTQAWTNFDYELNTFITSFDFTNDGNKEVLISGQIMDISSSSIISLSPNKKLGLCKYNLAIDINNDGSIDYFDCSGTDNIFYINGYTNQAPVITSYSYNTGNPICLFSSIDYEVYFTDSEGDLGKVRIDRYGDGNFSGYGDNAGFPSQFVTYEKLGTFTSIIELTDTNNNVVTTTHGVIVQTSNCYTSGEGSGKSTTSSNASEIICTGIFCHQQGVIDGYTSNMDIYNSSNSIYIDEQRCINSYGTNYKQMFIPCFVRLTFVDVVEQLETWIIGSFIAVIIVLIVFFLYMIMKHKNR